MAVRRHTIRIVVKNYESTHSHLLISQISTIISPAEPANWVNSCIICNKVPSCIFDHGVPTKKRQNSEVSVFHSIHIHELQGKIKKQMLLPTTVVTYHISTVLGFNKKNFRDRHCCFMSFPHLPSLHHLLTIRTSMLNPIYVTPPQHQLPANRPKETTTTKEGRFISPKTTENIPDRV